MYFFKKILELLTGEKRYFPEFEYQINSWVWNTFRFFGSLFGEKAGIGLEMVVANKNGKQTIAFYSLESVLVFFENRIRSQFKYRPLKIYFPQFVTPQGINFNPGYLFAIAFDIAGHTYTGSGTTTTVNIAATGTNRMAILAIEGGTTSGHALSGTPTVGGSSTGVTQVATSYTGAGSGKTLWLYWFAAPSTSSAAYVATFNNTSDDQDLYVSCYTGVDQSAPIDSTANGTKTPLGTLTLTTTVIASGCWLFSICTDVGGTVVASTGTTARATGGTAESRIGDSNGTVGTGSQSMAWINAGARLDGRIISIAPVASTTFTPTPMMHHLQIAAGIV